MQKCSSYSHEERMSRGFAKIHESDLETSAYATYYCIDPKELEEVKLIGT